MEELGRENCSWSVTRGWLIYFCSSLIWLDLWLETPKVADLAALLQLVEGFCHFFRLHQGIRTVQDKHIQIVSAQTFQNAVYRR